MLAYTSSSFIFSPVSTSKAETILSTVAPKQPILSRITANSATCAASSFPPHTASDMGLSGSLRFGACCWTMPFTNFLLSFVVFPSFAASSFSTFKLVFSFSNVVFRKLLINCSTIVDEIHDCLQFLSEDMYPEVMSSLTLRLHTGSACLIIQRLLELRNSIFKIPNLGIKFAFNLVYFPDLFIVHFSKLGFEFSTNFFFLTPQTVSFGL